jgi:hypothetical protein
MNPEVARMAGSELGAFLTQFGVNTAKTAGRIGAEKLGTALGNQIGNIVSPPTRNPGGSSVDKAQAYRLQAMMLSHQQQLQQMEIEQQMNQQKYMQQLGTIQARHQYDRPNAMPSALGGSMGQSAASYVPGSPMRSYVPQRYVPQQYV